jgi:multisubunit Na+/H+ antiporter MnhB subunit
MFQSAFIQRTSSLLSAAIGGYGVFCVVYSFSSPEVAAQALILLGSACALSYFGRP